MKKRPTCYAISKLMRRRVSSWRRHRSCSMCYSRWVDKTRRTIMRISTNTMFDMGSAQISNLTSAMQKTQQQLSTGLRVVTPADDPVAAAQAVEITQAQSVNAQYTTNRQSAEATLGQVSNTLASVTSLLQDSRSLVVSAGNTGTLSNS